MENLSIISDNNYFHHAVATLTDNGDIKKLKCSGNIVIVDICNIENIETLSLKSFICYMIILIPNEENKSLFDRVSYKYPVTYLLANASMDLFIDVINTAIYDINRKRECIYFTNYSSLLTAPLNTKELTILDDLMVGQGTEIEMVLNHHNINIKTAKNYRTSAVKKSFSRLSVKNFKAFRFYKKLEQLHNYQSNDIQQKFELLNCPISHIKRRKF